MSEPRINIYVCEFGCQTVTVDVDDGVTPFMIGCRSRSTPKRPIDAKWLDDEGFCKGSAQSCFYPKGPMPPHIKQPEWEWFSPRAIDLAKMDPEIARHYKEHKGELALRPRTLAKPINHPEAT